MLLVVIMVLLLFDWLVGSINSVVYDFEHRLFTLDFVGLDVGVLVVIDFLVFVWCLFAACGLGCLGGWLLCVLLVTRVVSLLSAGLCRVCVLLVGVWCCGLVCGLLHSDCLWSLLFICVIDGVGTVYM